MGLSLWPSGLKTLGQSVPSLGLSFLLCQVNDYDPGPPPTFSAAQGPSKQGRLQAPAGTGRAYLPVGARRVPGPLPPRPDLFPLRPQPTSAVWLKFPFPVCVHILPKASPVISLLVFWGLQFSYRGLAERPCLECSTLSIPKVGHQPPFLLPSSSSRSQIPGWGGGWGPAPEALGAWAPLRKGSGGAEQKSIPAARARCSPLRLALTKLSEHARWESKLFTHSKTFNLSKNLTPI